MQTTITTYWGETKVAGWLHRAQANNTVLVVLIHGHNSQGTEGRFIELAKHFNHHGIDCLRFSITRQEHAHNEFVVTTLSEEVGQAKALFEKIRPDYDKIVAIGHSQGGITALQLALDGLADGVVFLMSAFDTELHARKKMERFGVSADTLLKGISFTNYDGRTMLYTKAIFDEFVTWEPYKLIGNWYGPSLFILGSQDTTVTEAELRKAFDLANDPKEFHSIQSDHRFTAEHAVPIVETVVPWMEKNALWNEEKR